MITNLVIMQTRKNNQAGTSTKKNIERYCIAGGAAAAVKGATFCISIAIGNIGRKLKYPIVDILIYSEL